MSLLALQLHVSLTVVHSPVTANTCIVITKIMFELKNFGVFGIFICNFRCKYISLCTD